MKFMGELNFKVRFTIDQLSFIPSFPAPFNFEVFTRLKVHALHVQKARKPCSQGVVRCDFVSVGLAGLPTSFKSGGWNA